MTFLAEAPNSVVKFVQFCNTTILGHPDTVQIQQEPPCFDFLRRNEPERWPTVPEWAGDEVQLTIETEHWWLVPCACASFQMMLIEELEPAAAGSTQAVSLCRRCGPGQRGTLVENCHPEPIHASPTKGHAVAIRGGAAMGGSFILWMLCNEQPTTAHYDSVPSSHHPANYAKCVFWIW